MIILSSFVKLKKKVDSCIILKIRSFQWRISWLVKQRYHWISVFEVNYSLYRITIKFIWSIAHWLALNGKQPKINENPIIHTPRQTLSRKKFDKLPHILSMVNRNDRSWHDGVLIRSLGTTDLLQRTNWNVCWFRWIETKGDLMFSSFRSASSSFLASFSHPLFG